MKCEYCDIVNRESKSELLYEDADLIIAIKDTVLTPGQVTIFPRQHFTILEMVPEEILQKCFVYANKAGMAVFEGLQSQGTNIIVQNGLGACQKVPHFAIEVIPRTEGDGLQLQWQPKQLMEDEIENVFAILKEEAGKIDLQKKKKAEQEKEVVVKDEKTEMKVVKEKGENYLLKSLRRVP